MENNEMENNEIENSEQNYEYHYSAANGDRIINDPADAALKADAEPCYDENAYTEFIDEDEMFEDYPYEDSERLRAERLEAKRKNDEYNEQLRKTGRRILWTIAAVMAVVSLLVGVVIGLALRPRGSDEKSSVVLAVSNSPVTDTTVIAGSKEPLTYAQVAAKVRRAVVGVNVYASSYGWGSYIYSEGSGFIISDDGYIITNSHVIQDEKYPKFSITVNIEAEDGTISEHEVDVIGFDTRTDLAVLKLKEPVKDLVVAELGDSTALVLGDEVVAIGNPGGAQFAGSVTNGIVSGVDRMVGGSGSSANSDSAMKYIQTNAAINPGNSGGPLLNMYGQVIGINSAKIVADGYEGLGFAIPMDKAKPIVEQLISVGSVVRPTLGGNYSVISEQMSAWYDVPVGLMLRSVSTESKLPEAGAKEGDIITACNGKPVTTNDELQEIVEGFTVGDKVTLTIFRSGEEKQFDIEVELVADTASDLQESVQENPYSYYCNFGW